MKSSLSTLIAVLLIATAIPPAIAISTQKESQKEPQPKSQQTRYGVGYEHRKMDQEKSSLADRERGSDEQQPQQKNRTAERQP
ncbi:MAG: hypothetical protein L3J26_05050 [Candidatus Polarisedimenticolaceae bacterium]|nr:hypothetical protein [Candidatus Polarisedimenticolaceae bacterium]